MQSFREIFENYGADYDTTMVRFIGNEQMYLKFMDMLFQDDNFQKLGSAINEHDLKAGFEAAHTLKGVAANMGLTPLYNSVCAIVEPLRARKEDEDYPVLYAEIQREFKRVEALREELKGAV